VRCRVLSRFLAAAALAVLVACNGRSGGVKIGLLDRRHQYALAPAIVSLMPSTARLYVANQADNTVSVFDLANLSAAPTMISGGGLNDPHGVAVDASGKLYVANQLGNSVSVFDTAHGNAVLHAITGGGLDFPQGDTVSARGKLYVANVAANSVSVFDTAHGNAVLPAISGGGLNGP